MNNTTVLTILGTLAGISNHLATTGVNIPQNKSQWASFGFSIILGMMGYVAKGVDNA